MRFRRSTPYVTGSADSQMVPAGHSESRRSRKKRLEEERIAALLDQLAARSSDEISRVIPAIVDKTAQRVLQVLDDREEEEVKAREALAELADAELLDKSTDDVYATFVRRLFGKASPTSTLGVITEVTVLGELKNGEMAWVHESLSLYGTIPNDLLGDMSPLPDDRLRVRVVSYAWGHVVTAVVPNSLISPYAVRSVPEARISSAGAIPDLVRGTSNAALRPGDIVLARIPYDGTGLPDRRGKIFKFRPAVFIRWQEDYAWLRAIYGASGRVSARGLGVRLIDSSDLDKASVVRNAEYDIEPASIVRRLGRLGPRDLAALGIDDALSGQSSGIESTQGEAAPHFVDPILGEVSSLRSALGPLATGEPYHNVLKRLLAVLLANETTHASLVGAGLPLSKLGQVYDEVTRSTGVEARHGKFQGSVEAAVSGFNRLSSIKLAVVLDANKHPLVRVKSEEDDADDVPEPLDRSVEPPSARLYISDDYLEPDVIIYDQESMSLVVRGARIDLAAALQDLRQGTGAPAYVIGPDEEAGWAAFQRAAKGRGWGTITSRDRSDLLSKALEVVRAAGGSVVTVVGCHPDLLAGLENLGFQVNEVNQIDGQPDDPDEAASGD